MVKLISADTDMRTFHIGRYRYQYGYFLGGGEGVGGVALVCSVTLYETEILSGVCFYTSSQVDCRSIHSALYDAKVNDGGLLLNSLIYSYIRLCRTLK